MINNLLKKIESQKITIGQWIISFIGIVYIRFFLESLSNQTAFGIVPSDNNTLVHYGLFFITITLGLICVLTIFAGDKKIAPKLVLFGLPIIWFGPIFDILTGNKVLLEYIFDSGSKLFMDFLLFFSPSYIRGASFGIRLEILIVIISIGYYVWKKRKNFYLGISAFFISFLIIFLMASIPGIISTFKNSNTTNIAYISNLILKSNIPLNTFHEGLSSQTTQRLLEISFNKFMSQILFIISLLFSFLYFWLSHKEKSLIIIKNSRLERILYYFFLILLGCSLSIIKKTGSLTFPVDYLGLFCLFFSWFSAWMFAIHTNDVADVEADKISNPNRPLIKNELDQQEMKQVGYIWLCSALLGAWSVGYYPFFMLSIWLATSYTYSEWPLRLKRIPVLSSFLMGLAGSTSVLAGFFFVSFDKKIQAFPLFTAIGLVIIIMLTTNIKDIKDKEGDLIDDVKTIPTIFKNNGEKIIALCFSLGFLLIPLFFSSFRLYIASIPAALMGYRVITQKPFKEKRIFLLYFAFIVFALFLY